jgi:hypothetical protein
MSDSMQNILVLVLVLLCVGVVVRGAWKSLMLKRGGIGSCCSRGCGENKVAQMPEKQRVVFVPVENLAKKRKGA